MSANTPSEALQHTIQLLLEDWTHHHGSYPPVLYHYTSAEGVTGILASQSLWMTDIRYMNDLSELQYATDLLAKRIEHKASGFGLTPPQRDFLGRCGTGLGSFAFGPAVFSASFCEDGNLLSQWRAYRGLGGGYAIGFDFIHTIRLLSRPCLLRKMIYDPTLQNALLDSAIDTFLEHIRHLDTTEPKILSDELAAAANAFSQVTMDVLLSLKHPAFQEEREWRLLYMDHGNPRYDRDVIAPKMRTFDGNIIPYNETSFAAGVEASKDDTAGIRFPIAHVRIGPTVNAELNRESVMRALLGIAPDVEHEISDSGIPLRWL